MRNRRERPLKELYDAARKLSEPEITPVLQGTCRIQGPTDDANYNQQSTNSGEFPVEERCLFVREKLHTRAESGTCNICSSPCMSCLHLKRTVLIMESKLKAGLSHNTSGGKENDSCSIAGDKGPSFNSRECDGQQQASSEISNLLSSTSSHDSCFENSESKPRFRVSIADDASEDVKTLPKDSSDEAVKLLLEQTSVSSHSPSPSHHQTTADLLHKTVVDQVDQQNILECNGDSISCISGVKDTKIAVHGHMDSDNKKATSSIPSTCNLLSRKAKKPIQNETNHDCHIAEIKESQNDFKRPSTWLEEYLQKNSGSSSANAGSFLMSEHSKFHPSKSDNSSLHNSVLEERDACSQLPAELLESYIGNKESSLAGELIAGSVDGQENTALAKNEINNTSNITSEPASVSLEDTDAYMGTDIDMDSRVPSDDAKKCGFMKEPTGKSNLAETANMQVSEIQPKTTSDNENSAVIEDDVKVCDICGDAGQEESLAICSRCSDGAEHIYCMQIMLDKLPEGDWLCEGCQLKEEEAKNQKVNKSEEGSEMLEAPFSNEKDQSSGSAFNSKILPNLETREINSDIKGAKGLQSTQNSTKRHTGNLEVISLTENRISDASGGSARTTGIASPTKNTALSCESSFNNLDVGKAKPVNSSPSCGGQLGSGSHPIADSQASSGSNPSKIPAQFETTRGFLSKSVSFNSSKMPKVKQLIGSVPLRQKVTSSCGSRKEGWIKTLTRSSSCKSSSPVCSTESANKTQPLDPLRAEYPTGGKQVRERNVINKKNSLISDFPSIGPLLSSSTSTPPKVDIKFPQHDGKSNKPPDSSNVGTNRGSNNANNLGYKEVKKQSSFSSRTSGRTSNGLHKSEDQKLYQPISKENGHASSSTAARSCCDPDLIQQCSTPQAAESTLRDEKTRDHTFSSSPRQAASGSSRTLHCQRCNETGHMAQFCAVDKLRMSAVKPSAERNLREGNNKKSKWKDVVEPMNPKTRPLENIRSPDQSEEISTSSVDQNSEVSSKDFLSGSLSCPRYLPSMEGAADGKEMLRSSADFSQAAVVNVKQKTSYQEETVGVSKDGSINTILNTSVEFSVKPLMHDFPGQTSLLARPLRASIIPKLEFIWQGGFEVLRTGGHSELYDGLQAHSSTCVLPKALEAGIKFPCIIQLEEVLRSNSWPSQFQGSSPKEENISLFFFAKDIESYKNNYNKLLENMVKNDLALRANMDGAELLVFTSNLLPENSQRWNNLLFLWSVFRERKEKCPDDMPALQEQLSRPNLNMDPLDQDLPAPIISGVSSFSKISYHENSDKELSSSERSPKRKMVNSTGSIDSRDNSSSGIKDRTCNAQEYFFVKPLHQEAVDNKMPLKHASGSLPVSSLGKSTSHTCPESNLQWNYEQSRLGVKDDVTLLNNFSNNSDGREDAEHLHHVHASNVQLGHGENGVLPTYSVSSYCRQGTEIKQKDNFMNRESVLNNPPENVVDIDHVSLRRDRKEMQSSTMERLSHVSGETILWKEEANCSINDEKECKKMKLINGGVAGCSSREEILNGELSSNLYPLSFSFMNNSTHDATMPESSRSVERNFFPVDPGPIRGKKAENFIYLSSDDEDLPESRAPDLKLALGGKKKSPEEDILPLFPPKFGEKNNQDKLPAPAADGDDVSASLSLSLAFPAWEKEYTAKSVLKTEQLVPEKTGVNTSFFFFRGFTDT